MIHFHSLILSVVHLHLIDYKISGHLYHKHSFITLFLYLKCVLKTLVRVVHI